MSKSACCYTQGSPSPSNTELLKVLWISERLRRLCFFVFFFEAAAHYFIVKSFNIAHINISFHYIGLMNNAGRVEEGSQGQWLLLLLLFLFAVMALFLAQSYTLFSYCSLLLNWLVLFRENHCRPFCFLVMSLCSSCACARVHRPVESAQKLRAEAIIAARKPSYMEFSWSVWWWPLVFKQPFPFCFIVYRVKRLFFPEFNHTVLERVADRRCLQMMRDLPVAQHEAGRRADRSTEIRTAWPTRHSYTSSNSALL